MSEMPATPPPTADTVLPAEDPRDRRRIITSNCAMFGAGAAVCALTFLLVGDLIDGGHVAPRIAADAALLLFLLAYISLSTRSAVRQLVEMVVALVRTAVADTIRREVREQLKEPGDKMAEELATIRERVGNEPTVPLNGRARTQTAVYASASMTTVTTSWIDATIDRLVGRVEETLKVREDAVQERLDEMDGRLHDFALLAQGQQRFGGRTNGSVARLPGSR